MQSAHANSLDAFTRLSYARAAAMRAIFVSVLAAACSETSHQEHDREQVLPRHGQHDRAALDGAR
jgi:hypothetical protein